MHAMNLQMRVCYLFLPLLLRITAPVLAQDPVRFKQEVIELTKDDQSLNKKNIILFTGSSTIKMWTGIRSDFPKYNVVNRGFGGSQTSDLLYYFDQLILPYHAKKIFIYEGDNDLSAGKSPEKILSDMDSLITLIRQKVSAKVPVYIISPKPSVARWHLKEKYIELNNKMKELATSKRKVHFIDVWTPALDSEGNVFKDIFLEDGLHMNRKGYAIWIKTLRQYLP